MSAPNPKNFPGAFSRDIPAEVARMFVERLFAARKGHGGGPCTTRNLDRETIDALIRTACEIAIDADRKWMPR